MSAKSKILLICAALTVLIGIFTAQSSGVLRGKFLSSSSTLPYGTYGTQTCPSITQFGITWQFQGSPTCGQFANGDWWVVGPVTITKILPESITRDVKIVKWGLFYSFVLSNQTTVYTLSGSNVISTFTKPAQTTGVITSTTTKTITYQSTSLKLWQVKFSDNSVGYITEDNLLFRWTNNGTMVNPPIGSINTAQFQGFDNSLHIAGEISWDAALNKSPSFTGRDLILNTGSVVSSISALTPAVKSIRPHLTDAAILTVVASVPRAGSFRPAPVSNDKTIKWNKDQLNKNILKKLDVVPGTPALSTYELYFERPWFSFMEHSGSRYISPANNYQPEYARDQARRVSEALLLMHLNFSDAQKEKLLISLVQYGIDIYGSVTNGMVYHDSGALSIGRKAPMLFAGLMLGDNGILDWSDASRHFVFQEDRQVWFVGLEDVGRVMLQEYQNGVCWKCRTTYTKAQADSKMPEWGETHIRQPNRDTSQWAEAYYRWMGGQLLGSVLVMRLIAGGEEAWNHPPLFAYLERYWIIEGGKGYNAQTWEAPNNISLFTYNMWEAYRNGGVPSINANLSISKGGNGTGTVTAVGVNCGTDCSETYVKVNNTQVTLTAVASADSDFMGWSGSCSGTGNCVVSMSESKSVTATFALKPISKNLSDGNTIKVISTTANVRSTPALINDPSNKIGDPQDINSIGIISCSINNKTCPTISDDPNTPGAKITWWYVDFNTGSDGWVGESSIEKTTTDLSRVCRTWD